MIKQREKKLNVELSALLTRNEHSKTKATHRHNAMPLVAFVGYTNAGKSALLNRTSGSRLESEDMLFQTLNTATRQIRLPDGQLV
jgi:GTPase